MTQAPFVGKPCRNQVVEPTALRSGRSGTSVVASWVGRVPQLRNREVKLIRRHVLGHAANNPNGMGPRGWLGAVQLWLGHGYPKMALSPATMVRAWESQGVQQQCIAGHTKPISHGQPVANPDHLHEDQSMAPILMTSSGCKRAKNAITTSLRSCWQMSPVAFPNHFIINK